MGGEHDEDIDSYDCHLMICLNNYLNI